MTPKKGAKSPQPMINSMPNPNTLPGQGGSMSPDAMSALGMGGGTPPDAGAASPDAAAAGSPMGEAGGGAGTTGMATPDQMNELQQLFGQVQGANSQLATKQLISRNEITNIRQQLLSKMFQLMQEAGVDPGNPDSIRQFLSQLEQKDPALLQLFQDAFQVISQQTSGGADMSGMSTGDEEQPEGPGANSPGMSPLTSQFQNLQRMS